MRISLAFVAAGAALAVCLGSAFAGAPRGIAQQHVTADAMATPCPADASSKYFVGIGQARDVARQSV